MNFSALNTHAIGVISASAEVTTVEGAASFNAGAAASAQATIYSYTTVDVISSVALTTTQFVVRNAMASASMSCNAASNVEGYRVQFSNAEIISNASFVANVSVDRLAVASVAATGSVVSIGSRVAYASASLQAECNLTANSGKVIFASAITGTNGYWTSGTPAVYGWSHYQNLYVTRSGRTNNVYDIAPGQNYYYSYYPRDNSSVYRTVFPAIAHGYNSNTYYRYQLQNYGIVTAAIAPVFIETAWQPTASLIATAYITTNFYGITAVSANSIIDSTSYVQRYVTSVITASSESATNPHRIVNATPTPFLGSSLAISVGSKKAVAHTTLSATATLDASAIVINSAAAIIYSTADFSSYAAVEADVSAEFDSSAAIDALDYVERISSSEIIGNAGLVVQPVRSVIVTAEVGCASVVDSGGYVLLEAEGSILCSSTIEISAAVESVVSAAVNVDSTCTAEGYNLSLTTASFVGTGSLVSTAEVQVYAQGNIPAYADVSSRSSMVHDVEAHISGLSLTISVAEKIAVSHSQLTCIATLSAEAYSESHASSAIACATNVLSSAYIPNFVSAEADISETGYETAAVYHPEVVTPGYWIPAVTQWQSQSGIEQMRSGPSGPNSGSYLSGYWWTDDNGNNLSGATTSTWKLELPYFGYIPPASGGPAYRYSILKNIVITAAIWVPPVVTQAAYTAPAFWTATTYGPQAEVIALGLITTGSYAYTACVADVSSQASVIHPVTTDILSSANILATCYTYSIKHVVANIVGSSEINTSPVVTASAQAVIDAEALIDVTGIRDVIASATISYTGYTTPASITYSTTWSDISGAWLFRANTNNYSRWYNIPNAASSDYWVTSSSNSLISSQGLRLGSSFAYSTHYETDNSTSYNGYSYRIEEPTQVATSIPEFWTFTSYGPMATVVASASRFTELTSSFEGSVNVDSQSYITRLVSADIDSSANINASAEVYDATFSSFYVYGSSEVSASATLTAPAQAAIIGSASVDVTADRLVTGTAYITDTGYNTEAVYHPSVLITAGYSVAAVVQWQVVSGSVVYANGNYSYGYISYPYRQGAFDSSWTQGSNSFTSYDQEKHVETAAAYYVQPVYSVEYTEPAFWTVTGVGPVAEVSAEATSGLLTTISCTASFDASLFILIQGGELTSLATAEVTESAFKYANAQAEFEGSSVTISTSYSSTNTHLVIEASSDITAQGYIESHSSAEALSVANAISDSSVVRWANAELIPNSDISAQAARQRVVSANAASSAALTTLHPSTVISVSASINALAQASGQAHTDAHASADMACTASFVGEFHSNFEASANVDATAFIYSDASANLTCSSDIEPPSTDILIFGTIALVAISEVSSSSDKVVRWTTGYCSCTSEVSLSGIGTNDSFAIVSCTSELIAQPNIVKLIPAVTVEGTADFNVAFTLVTQEGTRSNGILILVETENRTIEVESIDRSTLIELDARIVYAEAA